jgi:hypothetical protein
MTAIAATDDGGAARRARRAALARSLVQRAPAGAGDLDWDDLLRVPEWLALSDAELALWRRRVGAALCARSLRLWIDGPRLAAARALLGESFLSALIAVPEGETVPHGLVPDPQIDGADQVGVQLQAVGTGVLLAAVPRGRLRRIAEEALGSAATPGMTHEMALTVVRLATELAAAPARSAP